MFRVSLALMKMNESKILHIQDFESMMTYLQRIHEDVESVDELLHKAFALPLKHVHLEEMEDKYDRMCLQRQRRTRRDVSEMEQPIFIQRLSQTSAIGSPSPSGSGAFDVPTNTSSPKQGKQAALNEMYAKKVERDKAKQPDAEEEEEKKEDGDGAHEECNAYDEGSHSSSSEVDEEPSSLLPNGKQHEAVPPTDDEECPR